MTEEIILLRRFGRQIRIFRKQKMISREELGSRTGLSPEEIGDLEAGNLDPHLSTILLIARALDVRPEDLMIPAGGSDAKYYAYRFYLLKLIGALSKKDMKEAIEVLHELFEVR